MNSRIILIICCLFTATALAANKPHYMIVIDGGSSHTGLFAYRYDINARTGLPEHITTVSHASRKPGISNVNPQAMSAYLTPLFSIVSPEVPKETPLYFYGTAGMRLLAKNQQTTIYQAINNWIHQHSSYQVKALETINGSWEGAFDWLALNYLLGAVQTSKATAGILDMGGASSEIVYELSSRAAVAQDSVVDMKIGDRQYRLYSQSYLGLGQDQVALQFLQDPACYPINYLLPTAARGYGSFASCSFHLERFINAIHHVRQNTPNIPSAMDFYAVSGYYYTANAKLFNLGNDYTPYELSTKGSALCGTDWQTLQSRDPNDPFLSQLCMNSTYQYTLLTDGFGFPSTKTFFDPKDINGDELDWTLGIMIYYGAKLNEGAN